ncbi:MAG: efflux RND transporter periplasmic adaptor subunit [Bryobacteraceae bacterium]|nr:efflux RND transporter periplasmic adaptor subunit [Bryobacteraceae bacterium]
MKKAIQFAAFVSTLALVSCGGEPPAKTRAEAAPVRVQATAVEEREWQVLYEATGTVRARTAATLSSKVMGYVREVKAQVGDSVKAGQSLVVLDSRDLDVSNLQAQAGVNEARSAMAEVDNAIAAAQAQLELAQATFRRMKDLFDKKSISDQEFDEASARLKLAEANHEMARSKKTQLSEKIRQAEQALASTEIMRGYAEIKAPFNGRITEKSVEPGNLAAPGAPLLVVEQAGGYRFEASVEESRLPFVRLGQEVTVELDALGQRAPARVSEIVPAVDAASRTFIAKVNLPNLAGLKSGLFGRARFQAESRKALTIPREAVTVRGQMQSVFVVEGNRARARLVTLGQGREDQVEVLSGLAPGDQLVHPVPPALTDGAAVEVAR